MLHIKLQFVNVSMLLAINMSLPNTKDEAQKGLSIMCRFAG
jgi:hypothetical protein